MTSMHQNTIFNFRLIVTCTILNIIILFPIANTYAQNTAAAPVSIIDLRAAELYSNNAGSGKVDIYLKVYYDISSNYEPATEHVSVFESRGNRLVSIVELIKDTSYIQGSQVPLSCDVKVNNKLRAVLYHARIDLGLMYNDYDISWGFCCLDPMIKNMDLEGKKASALTVTIQNPALDVKNSMPFLTEIPVHKICRNTTSAFSLKAIDSDSDKVNYSFSTPLSSKTTNQRKYDYPATDIPNANVLEIEMGFSGTFLTGHPPFEPLTFKKGYTESKPMTNQTLDLNFKTGEMSYSLKEAGKYLLTFSVSEQRNNTKLSEHQILLILEIL